MSRLLLEPSIKQSNRIFFFISDFCFLWVFVVCVKFPSSFEISIWRQKFVNLFLFLRGEENKELCVHLVARFHFSLPVFFFLSKVSLRLHDSRAICVYIFLYSCTKRTLTRSLSLLSIPSAFLPERERPGTKTSHCIDTPLFYVPLSPLTLSIFPCCCPNHLAPRI